MKKHSKKLISKGWMRLHIILSLIPTPISFIYYGISDQGLYIGSTEWRPEPHIGAPDALAISVCSLLLYWIVLGLTVWIKKGFKE